MEEKKIDAEQRIFAAIASDQGSKFKKNPREVFLARHRGWINFLNEDLSKLDKITTTWLTLKGNHSHETVFDLNRMTEALRALGLRISRHEGQNSFVVDEMFHTEKELMVAVRNFMYENLKAIIGGECRDLSPVGMLGTKEVNRVLSAVKICVVWNQETIADELAHDYENKENTYIPNIARFLHRFLEYITEFLDGGTKEKAKDGFYKIAVCPWKDCGKVFVCRTYTAEACKEHSKRWRLKKSRETLSKKKCLAKKKSL